MISSIDETVARYGALLDAGPSSVHTTSTSVRNVQRGGIAVGEFGVGLIAGARWRCAHAAHAPAIAATAGLHLRGVADEFHGASHVRAHRMQRCTRTALLERADVDVVVVASRAKCHFADAKAALLAGKHAVVELPLAQARAEVDELVAIARARRVALLIMPTRRADADFREVERLVRSGELGPLRSLERRAEVAEPQLWSTGAEMVDEAVALFGAPRTVSADERNGESGFAITLGYSGAAAPRCVRLSAVAAGVQLEDDRAFAVRWELHGARGSLVLREPEAPRGGRSTHARASTALVGLLAVEPYAGAAPVRTELTLSTDDERAAARCALYAAMHVRLRRWSADANGEGEDNANVEAVDVVAADAAAAESGSSTAADDDVTLVSRLIAAACVSSAASCVVRVERA